MLKTLWMTILAIPLIGLWQALPASAQSRHVMDWSGSVDDVAVVRIHRDVARTEIIAGDGVKRVHFNFWSPLPDDRDTVVDIEGAYGRGTINIVQQPSADNNYTAVVQIHDPQPGRSFYHFTLHWRGDDHPNGVFHRQLPSDDDDDNG